MSRGKQAIAAANRRAREAVSTDLATYQRKVAQQASEIAELRAALVECRRKYADDTRALREQLRLAVSPELKAAQETIARLKRQVEENEFHMKGRASRQSTMLNRMLDHMRKEHHMDPLDAFQLLCKWGGMKGDIVDNPTLRKAAKKGHITPEIAIMLDRHRWRRTREGGWMV